MKRFCIIPNQSKDIDLEMTNYIKNFLEARDAFCYVCQVCHAPKIRYTDAKALPENIECVIVLGGDGTLIRASRDLRQLNIPILGVNLGTLGFLTEVDYQSLEEALENLLADRFTLEKRMMIEGQIIRDGEMIHRDYAINDIVIARGGSIHVIEYEVNVNQNLLCQYKADGLILSTPTGSTAYNLSAGGPLAMPDANLMIMTPICPHSLNVRSVILKDSDIIEIELRDRKNDIDKSNVTFDGEVFEDLHMNDRVRITKAPFEISFIKFSKESFLELLRNKLS